MEISDAVLAAQLAAVQKTGGTQLAAETEEGALSFDDLLSAANENLSQSDKLKVREAIFSGIADGSLKVTDGEKLVSAIISTIDETGGVDLAGGSGGLSFTQETLSATLSQGKNSQLDLVNQIIETVGSAQQTDSTGTEEGYYQAVAALMETRKKLMLE